MQFQFKIEIHGGGRGMGPRLGAIPWSSISYQNSSHHVGYIYILVWNWGRSYILDENWGKGMGPNLKMKIGGRVWDPIWKWNWGTKSLKDFEWGQEFCFEIGDGQGDFERREEFSFEITHIITGGLRGIHDFFRSLRDEAAQVVFWHGGVHGNEFGTRLRPRLAVRGVWMRTHCYYLFVCTESRWVLRGTGHFFSIHLWGSCPILGENRGGGICPLFVLQK